MDMNIHSTTEHSITTRDSKIINPTIWSRCTAVIKFSKYPQHTPKYYIMTDLLNVLKSI